MFLKLLEIVMLNLRTNLNKRGLVWFDSIECSIRSWIAVWKPTKIGQFSIQPYENWPDLRFTQREDFREAIKSYCFKLDNIIVGVRFSFQFLVVS